MTDIFSAGYVTSDCAAVSDIQQNHRYTNSTDATAAATLKSGMDIGCDEYLASSGVVQQVCIAGCSATISKLPYFVI